MVPILLPIQSRSAKDILSLIGECCSAKEAIIAIQESAELVRSWLSDGNDEDGQEDSEDLLSPTTQLITLISLYSSCTSSPMNQMLIHQPSEIVSHPPAQTTQKNCTRDAMSVDIRLGVYYPTHSQTRDPKVRSGSYHIRLIRNSEY